VRKSINHRVGIMIASATIPTTEARIRTQLYGTKRARWTRKGMSVPPGANKWIHTLMQRLYLRRRTEYQKQGPQKTKCLHKKVKIRAFFFWGCQHRFFLQPLSGCYGLRVRYGLPSLPPSLSLRRSLWQSSPAHPAANKRRKLFQQSSKQFQRTANRYARTGLRKIALRKWPFLATEIKSTINPMKSAYSMNLTTYVDNVLLMHRFLYFR